MECAATAPGRFRQRRAVLELGTHMLLAAVVRDMPRRDHGDAGAHHRSRGQYPEGRQEGRRTTLPDHLVPVEEGSTVSRRKAEFIGGDKSKN